MTVDEFLDWHANHPAFAGLHLPQKTLEEMVAEGYTLEIQDGAPHITAPDG